MAEEAATELAQTNPRAAEGATAEDMELVTAGEPEDGAAGSETNGVANGKRAREGEEEEEEEAGGGEEEGEGAAKKQKVEKSVEEERLEKECDRVKLGAKEFGSPVEMYDYFFNFLHAWPPNIDVNKYEHLMLQELIKKGHSEPEKKIGPGIEAFQVRYHPVFKSRCFFLIREDESVDDFSFRKCVDHIVPLPEDMKAKPGPNRALGGGKGRGGGGRGRGRGRGGKGRS
ncbi:protein EMBRYO DEFECTIVE 514 [Punica granatum]|uniref:Uncharacterized protein n=2 Tax=Punica granatum TaxID=22663 RepID=A0A218VXI4_PUNGR|nr:protein EMBRYO DEFECTIVE 514 [Punica granatum]OWM65297.1 hypothetical protein CDL15_Pgr008887 [Punica granatum]PKI63259.1 hypothetical protein CRG98_016444 [Punica granatum]